MQEKWREKSHEAVWMGHSGLEKSYMSYRPDYVGHRKSVKAICPTDQTMWDIGN